MAASPAATEAAQQGSCFDERHVDEEAQARRLSAIGFAPGFDQMVAGSCQGSGTVVILVAVSVRSSLRLRHKTLQFWFGR